jgi:hypothetical protein
MKSGTAKKGDRRYPIIHRKGLAHNGSGSRQLTEVSSCIPVLFTASSYRGDSRAYDRGFIELPSCFRTAAGIGEDWTPRELRHTSSRS